MFYAWGFVEALLFEYSQNECLHCNSFNNFLSCDKHNSSIKFRLKSWYCMQKNICHKGQMIQHFYSSIEQKLDFLESVHPCENAISNFTPYKCSASCSLGGKYPWIKYAYLLFKFNLPFQSVLMWCINYDDFFQFSMETYSWKLIIKCFILCI